MSDPTSSSSTPETSAAASTPASASPAGSATGAMTPEEIEKGKVFAVISYIFLIFSLVPLIMRDNRFSLYHAKQCVTLFICVFPLCLLSIIPLVGCITGPLVMIACIACVVIGIINVVNGRAKPLPVIGQFGEKWFASLDVKQG